MHAFFAAAAFVMVANLLVTVLTTAGFFVLAIAAKVLRAIQSRRRRPTLPRARTVRVRR